MWYLCKSFPKNMRKLFLTFLFITFTVGVSAQNPATIKLRNTGFGKITLIKNKPRVMVDLSREVAGCASASSAIKKALKDCAAFPPDFKLIDATVKNNQMFLLISSNAAGNCNVCGRCGADDALGLIWLKLSNNLRVLDKKGVAIDYCRMEITLVSEVVNYNEETLEKTLKLSFKENVLAIDFEKEIFAEKLDRNYYEFSHLEYNRKTPEKGFVIKTEKRAQSSIREQ